MRKLLPWLLGASCHAYVDIDDVEAHFQIGKARTITAKEVLLQKVLNDAKHRLEDKLDTYGDLKQAIPPGVEHFDPKMVSLLEKEVQLHMHAEEIQKHLGQAMNGVVSGIKEGATMDEVMAKAQQDLVKSGLVRKAQGWISNETKAKVAETCYKSNPKWHCPDSIRVGIYAGMNMYNMFCSHPEGCPILGYLQEADFVEKKAWAITKAVKSNFWDYLRWPTVSLFGAWSWTDRKFHLCFKVGLVELNDHKSYDPNQATSLVNLGWFAGFSDSTHFGTWGGSAGLQMVPYTDEGEMIKDIPAKAKTTSLGIDLSEEGGYTSIDLKGCLSDNSGCKTSDEAFYKLYNPSPKPWEDPTIKADLEKTGYDSLISYQEPLVEKVKGDYAGGFRKIGDEIYKVEYSYTPIYYETCTATSPINDHLDPPDEGPPTSTTTTTITETTTETTTLFPTTSLTTTTITTTAWWEFYMPDDLSSYTDRTVAPGKDINDIISNSPAWHPDPLRPTYQGPAAR